MGTTDIPRDETCYIVFPAKELRKFSRGATGIEEADHYAAHMARNTEEPYAILLVPSDFTDFARIARYEGVVMDVLKDSDLRDDE